MSEQHLTKTTFASLDLPENVLQGIEESGFSYCTPIQAESLPIALQGKDIAGQAQTGTGKTAAFLLATYVHLLKNPPAASRTPQQPRCMILAPTRELAIQIHKDAENLGRYTGFKHVAIYGGTGYDSQRKSLEDGVDILIGTPGRVIDYFKQHVFNLKCLQVMVLDEADRMFDLGFIKDIRYLLRRMPAPEQRLSMLFSATMSHRVNELAYEHMNNPESVIVESDKVTGEGIEEKLYYPAMDEKIPLLLGLLAQKPDTRVVIFVNTKRVAEKLDAYFQGNDIKAAVLSGDVPQTKRMRLLQEFTDGKLRVLVATDVAARGLHIPEVNLVINYDLPQDAEDYVHRIGRTGRAGAKGEAVSFACEEYVFSLPEVEEYIGYKLPVGQIDESLLIEPKPPVKIERKKNPHHRKGQGQKSNRRGGGKPHHHKKTTA